MQNGNKNAQIEKQRLDIDFGDGGRCLSYKHENLSPGLQSPCEQDAPCL